MNKWALFSSNAERSQGDEEFKGPCHSTARMIKPLPLDKRRGHAEYEQHGCSFAEYGGGLPDED